MKIRDIYEYINKIAPFDSAEEWDNVGLLIGDMNGETDNVIVALDCTRDAFDMAIEKGAKLIVTHHPVIFEATRDFTADTLPWQLAQAGISVISAHTNLDKAESGVNAELCKVIGIDAKPCEIDPCLVVGESPIEIPFDAFLSNIKATLGIEFLRVHKAKNTIGKIAVCCGSGGDFLDTAHSFGCDTLLTGDVKHNVFVAAALLGINLIDAGHFATEDIIVEPLAERLRKEFPKTTFFTSHQKPFTVC